MTISVGIGHDALIAVTFNLCDIYTHTQINAACAHRIGDMGACFIVKPAQNLIAAIHLYRLDAQSIHDTRKFRRDISTTHNDDGFWQFLHQENVV